MMSYNQKLIVVIVMLAAKRNWSLFKELPSALATDSLRILGEFLSLILAIVVFILSPVLFPGSILLKSCVYFFRRNSFDKNKVETYFTKTLDSFRRRA